MPENSANIRRQSVFKNKHIPIFRGHANNNMLFLHNFNVFFLIVYNYQIGSDPYQLAWINIRLSKVKIGSGHVKIVSLGPKLPQKTPWGKRNTRFFFVFWI